MATAEKTIAPYLALPTSLPRELKPLDAKPEPGETIVDIAVGSNASDVLSGRELVKAAATVGWTGKLLLSDGTVEDEVAKWNEAIAQKPTAIVSAGYPASVLSQPLKAATQAGIITQLNSVIDEPNAENGPTTVSNGGGIFTLLGQMHAALVLKATNCEPVHAVVVQQDFPVIKLEAQSFRDTLTKACSECKVNVVNLQANDLSTPAATNAIMSAVQADSKVHFVVGMTSSEIHGVAAAIKSAGLSDVKVAGSLPNEESMAGLRSGSDAWWLLQNASLNAWVEVDTILRAAASKTTVNEPVANPIAVLTKDNIPAGANTPPAVPTNYEAQFKQLWHVG